MKERKKNIRIENKIMTEKHETYKIIFVYLLFYDKQSNKQIKS